MYNVAWPLLLLSKAFLTWWRSSERRIPSSGTRVMPDCLYAVLGVSLDANEEDIRRAFRARALEWHPDKNLDRIEEAEDRFRAVKNAYEVLSDPRERAWYDRRRSSIIQECDVDSLEKEEIDLYRYFHSSCFQGYGSNSNGFYAVYDDVFARVERLEDIAASARGDDERPPAPTFGLRDDPLDNVTRFYSYWENFGSCRSFYWVDKHHPTPSESRKVRRLMDEENRKERKNARREYDETVRQLVAFVKKRDPRFKEWLALTKKEQEERRSAETERRKREQEERFRKAEEYVEPDWVRNAQEVELEDDIDSEEQEPQTDSIYCVVCNKKFKSEKQRINHLQSKKHLETLSRLREVLLEDDILEEDEVFDKKDFSPAFGGKDISAEIPSHSSRRKKKGAKKKKRAGECLASDSTENTAQASTFRRELAEEVEKLHVVEDFGHITAGAGDDQKIKEGGHAVRKARRRKQGKGEEHTRNACDICGIRFDSRNKMFQHIRDTGHASYK